MLDRIIGPDEEVGKPRPKRDLSGKRKAAAGEKPKGGEVVQLENLGAGGGQPRAQSPSALKGQGHIPTEEEEADYAYEEEEEYGE